jgi:glutamine cyclotransferase
MRSLFLCALAALGLSGLPLSAAQQTPAAEACAPPKVMTFRVESEIQRDVRGFTQGLEVHGDKLFESTGAIAGDTRLTTIDPATGKVTVFANFGKMFFGEGLTIFKDQIYQLSWQDHLVSVYDLNGKRLRGMRNPRDGWGLTNDGAHLIYTDGGSRLYYVNPESFAPISAVPVRIVANPVADLNELEYVDGKIYANIFTTWNIVRIDPASGCVEAVAQMNSLADRMTGEERDYLRSDSNFVLNGIAYDRGKGLFYVTGKNWKTIFAGRFVTAN